MRRMRRGPARLVAQSQYGQAAGQPKATNADRGLSWKNDPPPWPSGPRLHGFGEFSGVFSKSIQGWSGAPEARRFFPRRAVFGGFPIFCKFSALGMKSRPSERSCTGSEAEGPVALRLGSSGAPFITLTPALKMFLTRRPVCVE